MAEALTAEQRTYLNRRYALFKRLQGDSEFQDIFVRDYLTAGIREETITEQATLRGVELERSAARLVLIDEIRGHMARVVDDYERFLAAEQERGRRLAEGLPVDED